MGVVSQQNWAKLGVCFRLFFSLVEHPSVTGWNSHLRILQEEARQSLSVKALCIGSKALLWSHRWAMGCSTGPFIVKYLALLKSNLLLCTAFTKREIRSPHKQLSSTIKENGQNHLGGCQIQVNIVWKQTHGAGADTWRATDTSVWVTVAQPPAYCCSPRDGGEIMVSSRQTQDSGQNTPWIESRDHTRVSHFLPIQRTSSRRFLISKKEKVLMR